MSPARSRRTPVPHRRSRADLLEAVGAAVGIVAITALLIWLTRPGPAGTVGTGGMMSRQPRSSWLVGIALGLAAGATWWILRVSRRARGHVKVVLPIALGVVLVGAVVGAIAWPGGVLRHDQAPPPLTTTPSTTAPTSSSAVTTATTAVTTTTPTTGSATTTSP